MKFILVTLGAKLIDVLAWKGDGQPTISPARDGREYKQSFYEFGVN